MKNKSLKRLISVLLALMLVLGLTLGAYAAEEKLNKGSFTVKLTDKTTKEPVSGVAFKLYYVAENTAGAENPEYKYSLEFKDCSAKLNLDDSYLPVYLSFYAKSNDIEFIEQLTDSNGNAAFYNLKEGLYLLSSDNMTVVPFLFSIPEKDGEELHYDVVAQPKIDVGPETEIYQSIEVEKIWNAQNHPESIIAILLKDGEEYSQAVLSQNNNWSARWENLSSENSWQVVEKKVPDGFNVRYEIEGNKFIIINTANDENETLPQTESTTQGGDELEDTGELNWPVPVMAISGILIFSIGWVLLNLKRKSV